MEQPINFRSEEEWRSYFGRDLADLYAKVAGFLELRSEVEELVDEKNLAELIETSKIWEKVFFGGLTRDENNPLGPKALARFYRNIFGLGVDDKALATVISLLNQGFSLEKKTLRSIMPKFLLGVEIVLEEIAKKLRRVFNIVRDVVPVPEPKKYAIDDRLFGMTALMDVLNSSKRIFPLYNPLSFFIMSTYSIPRFYALKEYPELEEKEVKDLLEKFGISIVNIIYPGFPDEEMNRELGVIGHSEWSTGAQVRDVIIHLYALFQWPELSNFFTLEEESDEFYKYARLYTSRARRALDLDTFSKVLSELHALSTSYGGGIGNIFLHKSVYERNEGLKWPRAKEPLMFRYDNVNIEKGTVLFRGGSAKANYSDFVSLLSPLAFSGLSYIRPAQEKPETYVLCVLTGWESER